jgi:ribosomal protein S11
LFQGRYQSETVEDDRYLLSVLRYIHQNSVKAGICGRSSEYRWSSHGAYSSRGDGVTDTDIILQMFAQEASGQKSFSDFMEAEAEGADHMDAFENTDTALKGRMESLCGMATTAGFQALPADERDCNIRKLRAAGFSIRQIVRVTGVPFGVVRGVGR